MTDKLNPLLNELEGTLLFLQKHLEEYSNEDLDKIELELVKVKQFLRKIKSDTSTKEVIGEEKSKFNPTPSQELDAYK